MYPSSKTGLYLVLFSIIAGTSGCKNLDIDFNLNYSSTFSVPSVTGINIPLVLPTWNITTNAEMEFENHDTKTEWVKNIWLNDLAVNVVAPNNADLSFLKSIHLYLSADGEPEILAASVSDIPNETGKTLELEPTEKDLAAYIKQETFHLRAEVVTDKLLLYDIDLEADMQYHVSATAPMLQ